MIYHTMRTLQRNLPDGRTLVIPGGWKAYVLEVRAEDEDMQWQVQQYIHNLNMSVDDAMKLAYRVAQSVYTGGFTHKLGISTMQKAKRYAEMYPDLVVDMGDHYVLDGFDPEVLQGYYVPTLSEPAVVDAELEAMAESARRK